jgi:tRNA (cmo5U34)-methyltransferase
MINKLRERLIDNELQTKVDLLQKDIRDIDIANASMVVLNFVLQFLEPDQRTSLLRNIYEGMLPGSILVLSEKIAFKDPDENKFQINMHHDFKKLQGYSDLEISQKRAALEKVLIPDSRHTHMQRLKESGFSQSYLWFQCFNFISIVAIK